MIRLRGSWPITKAMKAIVTQIDLQERGGTLMMRRLISPRHTRSS